MHTSRSMVGRMLRQLESLDLEQLQEAARYFEQTAGPLLPRKEHERLFLARAVRCACMQLSALPYSLPTPLPAQGAWEAVHCARG